MKENKNFISREKANDILLELISFVPLRNDLSEALEDIRLCIVAEDMGVNVWGANKEDTAPLFHILVPPDKDAPKEYIRNYEAYLRQRLNCFQKYNATTRK